MNILDIAIAKKLAGGGGGSGTDNYNDLSNLPKINDVTLSGNKSSSALGLQSEITSENKLDSDLIDDTDQDNKFVTSSEKNTWNGKQNAIDADHKLNADYVDDSTSTNKFVTASDKEAWNAKQNAIDNSHKLSSDLVDDANHTNKFVTSTEKSTWNAKQNAIDSEHKLSSSLVSFTTAEAAALASGIDSAKVAQISTNQSNILYGLNTGVKNLLTIKSTYTNNGLTSVQQSDGYSVKITGTPTGGKSIQWSEVIKITESGTYKVKLTLSGTMASCYLYDVSASALVHEYYSSNTYEETLTANHEYAMYTYSQSAIDATISAMLCTAAAYAQSSDYIAPALPNYDLTVREAEDRASLAEVVDSGAKNLIPITVTNTDPFSDVHVTQNSDGSITIKATNTASVRDVIFITNLNSYLTVGKNYVLSGCDGGDYNTTYGFALSTSDYSGRVFEADGSTEFTYASDITVFRLVIRAGQNWTKTFKPMVATKAAFGVSQKFVPYKGNFITAPLRKSVRYNCTSTDYERITALDFVVPSDTYVKVTATLKFSNGAPRGIKIIDTAISNPTNAIVAINEVTENYGGITTSCLLFNAGTVKTYAVYTKSASVSGNDVIITIEYLS